MPRGNEIVLTTGEKVQLGTLLTTCRWMVMIKDQYPHLLPRLKAACSTEGHALECSAPEQSWLFQKTTLLQIDNRVDWEAALILDAILQTDDSGGTKITCPLPRTDGTGLREAIERMFEAAV